jgi:hypothetical protein
MVDSINKVIIHWGDHAYAKSYRLSVSTDQVKWTLKNNISNGTGGTDYVETLENVNGLGRYIQITFSIKGTERNYYSISEISVFGFPISTGIISAGDGMPSEYSLAQNYPNPFNPSTTIRFAIAKDGDVDLILYNILGEKIADLIHQRLAAGTYQVKFDASRYSSGVYFYTLRSGGYTSSRKMLLVK